MLPLEQGPKMEKCELRINDIKKNIEDEAKSLWQGKGANIELIQNSILSATQIILKQCEKGFGSGIEFPIQYVVNATKHFKEAIEKRDDYLLADCLYFEWREILIVFSELLEAVENKSNE